MKHWPIPDHCRRACVGVASVAMFCISGAAVLMPVRADAQQLGSSVEVKRKPDLADAVAGEYYGDVVSDSLGSSQSGVTLIVTRVGKNRVRIRSDYPRLPTVEVVLTLAMQAIVHVSGETTFVIDRAQDARRLDVSFLNEVTWSGQKR